VTVPLPLVGSALGIVNDGAVAMVGLGLNAIGSVVAIGSGAIGKADVPAGCVDASTGAGDVAAGFATGSVVLVNDVSASVGCGG
jgi:hypothetical protein